MAELLNKIGKLFKISRSQVFYHKDNNDADIEYQLPDNTFRAYITSNGGGVSLIIWKPYISINDNTTILLKNEFLYDGTFYERDDVLQFFVPANAELVISVDRIINSNKDAY